MEEIARAKLNLALHVRGREPDGYHRIETIFAFADDGDRLSVGQGEGLSLRITGPFAQGLSSGPVNLVLRAAEALRSAYAERSGATLTLDKRLPVASGIGGGSADAAAALRLLARWWGLAVDESELLDIAAGLGADVPACLLSKPARGEGRGDQLTPLDSLPPLPLLLVNPGMAISTADVFRAWDGLDRGALLDAPPLEAALAGRNDLEAPARGIAPEVGDVLKALGDAGGAMLVRMSGSGATCFALYEEAEQRDRAAAVIGARRPDWWLLASRLR